MDFQGFLCRKDISIVKAFRKTQIEVFGDRISKNENMLPINFFMWVHLIFIKLNTSRNVRKWWNFDVSVKLRYSMLTLFSFDLIWWEFWIFKTSHFSKFVGCRRLLFHVLTGQDQWTNWSVIKFSTETFRC